MPPAADIQITDENTVQAQLTRTVVALVSAFQQLTVQLNQDCQMLKPWTNGYIASVAVPQSYQHSVHSTGAFQPQHLTKCEQMGLV